VQPSPFVHPVSPSSPLHAPSPTLCRRLLREEVTSGRLAAAESKAEVLGDLVERVRFDAGDLLVFYRCLWGLALGVGEQCSRGLCWEA